MGHALFIEREVVEEREAECVRHESFGHHRKRPLVKVPRAPIYCGYRRQHSEWYCATCTNPTRGAACGSSLLQTSSCQFAARILVNSKDAVCLLTDNAQHAGQSALVVWQTHGMDPPPMRLNLQPCLPMICYNGTIMNMNLACIGRPPLRPPVGTGGQDRRSDAEKSGCSTRVFRIRTR